MKTMSKALCGAALGAGLLALSAASASAAIVCNGDVCWHTTTVYEYPSDAQVMVHPDSWNWGPSDHYVFREHDGRGYWRGDNWVDW